MLVSIRNYPLCISIGGFAFLISYVAFTSARRRTKPSMGGVGKETAHQLGTPLSSLAAWIDILRDKLNTTADEAMFEEMQKI